ncbi:polysaccharide pyruvyl transferase family protein [Kitasatospora sp. NPDC059646]|uniref:polysaccharide pyruvyl transferase family protein n=1 Tax=Kitasatospora sp. NPDC059646 TaxID=3346893 RepID=UPI0036B2B4E5
MDPRCHPPGPDGRALPVRRVLLTGWFSFLHGEATAGDVLAVEAVARALAERGTPHDIAWSPRFRPGGPTLDSVAPERYSHLVFVCGPLHSRPPAPGTPAPVAEIHRRFGHCRRIAVGVSVPDGEDPAVAGFHQVLARDGAGPPVPDLSWFAGRQRPVPVVGVLLNAGQGEYGPARRHEELAVTLGSWLRELDAARIELDTRLSSEDWRLPATPAQLHSQLSRLDVVLTTRLHGLVLGLAAGVPALAVDPVRGGAKVTAQARALDWPAVLPSSATPAQLDRWWQWCLGAQALQSADRAAARARGGSTLLSGLLAELLPPH